MNDAIITTMDRAGRIVLPKPIRGMAGLRPGSTLVIRYRDGRIEIEPQARAVRIVRKGRVAVAMPDDGVEEMLEASTVREALGSLRGDR